MSRAHTNGNDVDIDIARLFVAVWERRLAILSLILIVCAAAFVVSEKRSIHAIGPRPGC